MSQFSNQLLSVFIDKRALLLKDSEISRTLIAQGIPCYTDHVRQCVQRLSPGLFELTVDQDGTTTVCVDPKVTNEHRLARLSSFRFRLDKCLQCVSRWSLS